MTPLIMMAIAPPAWVFLKARDWRKQAKSRAGVWSAQHVYVFEGPSSTLKVNALKRLSRKQENVVIEALKNGEILYVNGKRPPVFLRCAIVEVANPWQESFGGKRRATRSDSFSPVEQGRRKLTAQEVDELHSHMRLAVAPKLLPSLIFTVLLDVWYVGFYVAQAQSELLWISPVFIVWVIAMLDICKTWVPLRNLKIDARRGYVQEQVEPKGKMVELLPFSGRVWTIDNKPAEWRVRPASVTGK